MALPSTSYLCIGLTLIHSVSGIAVNHVGDWNPSYSTELLHSNIGPVESAVPVEKATVVEILTRLGRPTEYRTTFQETPSRLQIFQTGNKVSVDLETGAVTQYLVSSRPGLYESNFLHLNHPKRIWTWVADAFGVALIVMAITGMLVLKGKKGITGRGLWLTLAGFVLPAVFLWLYV